MAPTHPDVEWSTEAFAATRRAEAAKARQYYDGHHDLNFTTEKFRNAFGRMFQAFADNLCRVVVDGPLDRLHLQGFHPVGPGIDGSDPDGPVADSLARLKEIYTAQRMDRKRPAIYREAYRGGEAFTIVWPRDDPDGPAILPQPPGICEARYATGDVGSQDRIDVLAKRWVNTAARTKSNNPVGRLTLMYADRIERFFCDAPEAKISNDARWEPYVDEDGDAVIPKPEFENRVPAFHYAPMAELDHVGRSALADVIPLQDALNKSIADMLVLMEFHVLPMRYATGITTEIDPATGREKPIQLMPGSVFTTGSKDAALGQLDGADLEPFLGVSESFRTEIARVGSLPLWWVVPSQTGTPPSGESLKVGEARLTAHVARMAQLLGDTEEDQAAYVLKLDRSARAAPLPESVTLEADWAPHHTVDETATWNLVSSKQLAGMSRRRSFLETGMYRPTEIETILEEAADETAASADAAMRAAAGGVGAFGLG